ncbi:MAG: hypothetical protein QOF10_4495 [Kribbellaceae bacterium]|nr:hypothetical protein [Kribbellaceae bacterium]
MLRTAPWRSSTPHEQADCDQRATACSPLRSVPAEAGHTRSRPSDLASGRRSDRTGRGPGCRARAFGGPGGRPRWACGRGCASAAVSRLDPKSQATGGPVPRCRARAPARRRVRHGAQLAGRGSRRRRVAGRPGGLASWSGRPRGERRAGGAGTATPGCQEARVTRHPSRAEHLPRRRGGCGGGGWPGAARWPADRRRDGRAGGPSATSRPAVG